MKFLYEYRTKENERRSGEISASSREGAFSKLKEQGIRPSKVVVAPGMLNKIASLGKGVIFLSSFLIVAMTSVIFIFLHDSRNEGVADFLDAQDRRQVIGDGALIEKGIRSGWSFVFEKPGDQFLASFAIPGVEAGRKSVAEKDLLAAMNSSVNLTEGDSIEVRQIKAMVSGMKDEMRDYIKSGGTAKSYGERLVSRQEEELLFYSRAKVRIERAQKEGLSTERLDALFENLNRSLRAMGIRTVSYSEFEKRF